MHLLDVLYKLWPIACGLLVILVVYWRTRSLFFVFHQILKWLGLEGKYTNSDDQKFADEYLDLNKFNLKTGFRLDSAKAKVLLHSWMHVHNLEFAELRRAGWYFKANKLSFYLPGRAWIWWTRGGFFALGVFFVATANLINNPNYALLSVTATGTWFWVGNNEAFSVRFDYPKLLRSDAWKIQQGDCRYTDTADPVESAWDKNVICRLVLGFNDESIVQAIDSQRQSAIVLFLTGMMNFGWFVLFTCWQRRAAQLHERLLPSKIECDSKAETYAEIAENA